MDKLERLELPKVRFEIGFEEINLTQTGIDKVEFLISTNVSEDLKPLAKVASGGEISRVMLAIKSIFAQADNIDTVIFDEIDTGISGATANAVGERLARLGQKTQTLVITHSPQVAGWGKTHYKVTKTDTTTSTVTSVQVLDKFQRLEEIARLVSGENITDHARAVAQELLHI